MDLVWNVYMEDFNARRIKVFNIFNHHSFKESVENLIKTEEMKCVLAEKVKRELQYYFWARAEWEMIFTSWPARITLEEYHHITEVYKKHREKHNSGPASLLITPAVGKKIDVYSQVEINFDRFIDYLWEMKNSEKNIKNYERKEKE